MCCQCLSFHYRQWSTRVGFSFLNSVTSVICKVTECPTNTELSQLQRTGSCDRRFKEELYTLGQVCWHVLMALGACIQELNQAFLPLTGDTKEAHFSAGICFREMSVSSPEQKALGLESLGHILISSAICEALTIFLQKIKAIFKPRLLSSQISFFLIICMCNNCLWVIPAEER